MKIEVETVEEHEDGSCTVRIDTDKEGTEELVKYAILNIFQEATKLSLGRRKVETIEDLPEALL